MKRLLIAIICFVLVGCDNDDDNTQNCNFLFDATVSLNVNTNLPQFVNLQSTSNGVYVPNQGNGGIWLWRLNASTLLAWDAADPSRQPSTCSRLESTDSAAIVASTCEMANQYSLLDGRGLEGNTSGCSLRPYRVDDLGNGQFLVTNF